MYSSILALFLALLKPSLPSQQASQLERLCLLAELTSTTERLW